MKLLLSLALIFSIISVASPVQEEPVMSTGEYEISPRTRDIAERFERDIKDGGLRFKIDRSLDAIINLAAYKLKRVGKSKEANQILKEWNGQYKGTLLLMRGIGSHAPLSQWLSDKYIQLEFLLGKDVMAALRLVDIHKFNHCIPVVVMCRDDVSENEFWQHFVRDDYYGWALAPITSYWVTFIGIVGGTWGSGFLWAAPIAAGTEWIVGNTLAPKLNAPVWKLSCKQGE